jgi:hypothetical protein
MDKQINPNEKNPNQTELFSEVSVIWDESKIDRRNYYSIILKSNSESITDLINKATKSIPKSKKSETTNEQEWIK